MQLHHTTLLSAAIGLSLYSTIASADHLSGGFDLGASSAILTESAIPLEAGRWYASLSTEIVDNKRFSDDKLLGLRAFDIVEHGAAHADLHSIEQISNTSLTVAYGYSDNLTLGLRLPYITRKNIREPEAGHGHDGPIILHDVIEHGDSSGLGDATLMGLYRFQVDSDASFALLFGMKVPTGAEDEQGFRGEAFVRRIDTGVVADADHDETGGHEHAGTKLETHQQPGSGSWDPILGFTYSRPLGTVDLNSSVLYTFANEGAQRTNLGDSFKYNLGLTYRTTASLDLVLELNGEWRERESRGSEVIANSGGSHLYLAPGVRYRSGNAWNISLSYGVPLAENIHGHQSEPDNRLFGNLSFNF